MENDSIQTANALEKVEQSVPYENKEKRFELLQEVLRIRILRLGVKNASVAKSIRALASFLYLQDDNEVLYDALMEHVEKIEKVIGKISNDDYDSEADGPEIQKWKTKRFTEKYLTRTGCQQHDLTFDDAAEIVMNWLDKQAIAYLNELTMRRSSRRSKSLNHNQRHKKLLAMMNQALPIARNIDEDERYPQNTVNLLALLSIVHKRLGNDELAQRYHDERLGIIVRYWGADHDVTKQAVKSST